MRLAAYARVSVEKDQEGLEGQVERLEAYARAYAHEIQVFQEVESASGLVERPVFEEVMEAVLGDGFDGLLVDALDRFARSIQDIIAQHRRLRDAGKELVIIRQHLDTSTKEGRLLFHMLAAIAEWERETIYERLKLGRERAKARGVHMGRPRLELPREEILELWDDGAGLPQAEIAARYGVHPDTIRRRLLEWDAVRSSPSTSSASASRGGATPPSGGSWGSTTRRPTASPPPWGPRAPGGGTGRGGSWRSRECGRRPVYLRGPLKYFSTSG